MSVYIKLAITWYIFFLLMVFVGIGTIDHPTFNHALYQVVLAYSGVGLVLLAVIGLVKLWRYKG